MENLRELCSNDSVWSIDIAYLLRRFNIDAVYYTIMKGVRPEYINHVFYQQYFAEDCKRVPYLFEHAESRGIKVVQRHITMQMIQSAVRDDTLVILLVHQHLLRCLLCNVGSSIDRPNSASHGFVGHYVIVYAWYEDEGLFLIKDPAAVSDTCIVSATLLEEARLAFGTDHDALFVNKEKKHPCCTRIESSSPAR